MSASSAVGAGYGSPAGETETAKAEVHGNATSGGNIDLQQGAVVLGTTARNQNLPAATVLEWAIQPPAGPAAGYTVESGQIRSQGPAYLGQVAVRGNARLNLSAGKYFFDGLTLESGSTIGVNTSAGPVLVYVLNQLIWRGATAVSGEADSFFLGYLGQASVALEAPFNGTAVLPRSSLRLAVGGTPHRGSFFGKTLEVDPDVRLEHRPFKHWNQVLPVVPSTTCVKRYHDSWAALFGYDNRLSQNVMLAFGSVSNRLNPSGTPEPAISTFAPGAHPQAFWASFPAGASISWQLDGLTATADASTRLCTEAEWLSLSKRRTTSRPDPIHAALPHASAVANLSPNRGPNPATRPTLTALQLGNPGGVGTIQQAQTIDNGPPVLLKFILSEVHVGEDGGGGEYPAVRVTTRLGDQSFGTQSVGPCPEKDCISTTGCVWATSTPINQVYQKIVPRDQGVPVHVDLVDHDGCSKNDSVGDVDLVIHPWTGTWTGDVQVPNNCSSGDWGVCWAVEVVSASIPVEKPRWCATWRAEYTDVGFGETVANQAGVQTIPAAFAAYELKLSTNVGVIFGFLDAEGCIPEGSAPAPDKLIAHATAGDFSAKFTLIPHLYDGTSEWRVRNTKPGFRSYEGPTGADGIRQPIPFEDKEFEDLVRFETEIRLSNSTLVNVGGWSIDANGFAVPPAVITLNDGSHTDITRTAAVLSLAMVAPDNGLPKDSFVALANDGCPWEPDDPSQNSMQSDACAEYPSRALFLGPVPEFVKGKVPVEDEWKYESNRWKYVIAHELGHLVQAGNGADLTSNGYPSVPALDADLCECDHVDVSNRVHCLNSLEDVSAVQLEGFAHFFAAKVFSGPGKSCGFNYYKEFIDVSCRPGTECVQSGTTQGGVPLFVSKVPFGVDCAQSSAPVVWRNAHCEDSGTAQGGVEYDWLLFYFNLHRVVQSPFSMTDMFSSYRAACGGIPCDEADVRFGELANGVRQVFQPNPGKVQNFLDAATLFGVATP